MTLRGAYSYARSGGLLAAAAMAASLMWGQPAEAELARTMRVASLALPKLTANTSQGPGEEVAAHVDLSEQEMRVYVGEKLAHVFPVSTARKGYKTPTGQYQVEWMHPKWRSRQYGNAPMPYSVFFYDGYAVHGTTATGRLGRPASHGCVRLATKNAKTFYRLIEANGLEKARIQIVQ